MGLLNLTNLGTLPQAKIYICELGTDTLTPLYSDENLTHLRANPLQTNANGEYDPCYVVEGSYRIYATDRYGKMLSELDMVQVRSPITETELLQFDTIADILQDKRLSYDGTSGRHQVDPGTFLFAEGRRYIYRVADADAEDAHVATAGGVKLYVQKTAEGHWPLLAFGAVGDGTTDDSEAFRCAFAAADPGDTVAVGKPPSAYIVDNVDCPERISLVSPGFTRYYNVYTSSDLTGLPVIRQKAGAAGCINFAGNSFVSGLIFDGRDKTTNGVSQQSIVTGMWFFAVSMVRFNRGFGTGNTLNNSRLIFCHANQNDKGIGNMVDSHVTNCEVNANRIGVDCQTGANDTIYTGNKIEWNDDEGFRFYGHTSSNIIMGGVIDRNGGPGISIKSSSQLQIGTVKLRRNGRTSSGTQECTHIYLEGNSDQSVSISNITTDYADDDGGGGVATPEFTFSSGGNNPAQSLLITGSDLRGSSSSVFSFAHIPTDMKIVGCIGTNDWITTGFPKTKDGQVFHSRFSTGNVAPGAYSEALICDMPPLGTQKRRTYGLTLEADNQTTGTSLGGRALFQFERDAGNARIDFAGIDWVRSAGTIGDSAAETLQIEIIDIASDASTFKVMVKNNHATSTFAIDGIWT